MRLKEDRAFFLPEQGFGSVDQCPQFFRVVGIIINEYNPFIFQDIFKAPFYPAEIFHRCLDLFLINSQRTGDGDRRHRIFHIVHAPHIQFHVFNYLILQHHIKFITAIHHPYILGIKVSRFILQTVGKMITGLQLFSPFQPKLADQHSSWFHRFTKSYKRLFHRFRCAIDIEMISIHCGDHRYIRTQFQKASVVFIGLNHTYILLTAPEIRTVIHCNAP